MHLLIQIIAESEKKKSILRGATAKLTQTREIWELTWKPAQVKHTQCPRTKEKHRALTGGEWSYWIFPTVFLVDGLIFF